MTSGLSMFLEAPYAHRPRPTFLVNYAPPSAPWSAPRRETTILLLKTDYFVPVSDLLGIVHNSMNINNNYKICDPRRFLKYYFWEIDRGKRL